jgi:hypothetical protein
VERAMTERMAEIIATVHARNAAMIPASTGLRL